MTFNINRVFRVRATQMVDRALLMSTNILSVLSSITSKSALTEKSKVAAPVVAAAPMFYSCNACTFRNKGTNKQCEMCGTPAPANATAKPNDAKANTDDSQLRMLHTFLQSSALFMHLCDGVINCYLNWWLVYRTIKITHRCRQRAYTI
jgi:hypothetical protein